MSRIEEEHLKLPLAQLMYEPRRRRDDLNSNVGTTARERSHRPIYPLRVGRTPAMPEPTTRIANRADRC